MGESGGNKGMWGGFFVTLLIAIIFIILWLMRGGDMDGLQRSLTTAQTNNQNLEADLSNARTQAEQMRSQIATLETRARELTRNEETLTRRVREYEARIMGGGDTGLADQLRSERDAIREELQAANAAAGDLTDALAVEKEARQIALGRVEALEKDYAGLTDALAVEKEARQIALGRVEALEKDHAGLTDALAVEKEARQIALGRIEAMEKAAAAPAPKAEQAQAPAAAAPTAAAQDSARVEESWRMRMAEMKKSADAALAAKDKEIAAKEQDIAAKDKEIAASKAEAAANKAEADKARTEAQAARAEAENTLQSVLRELDAARKEIEQLRKDCGAGGTAAPDVAAAAKFVFGSGPMPKPAAKIVSRVNDGQIMLTDTGAEKGVRAGMKFDVYRTEDGRSRYVGMVKVIRALKDTALLVATYDEAIPMVCPVTGRAVLDPEAKYSPFAADKNGKALELRPGDAFALPLEAPAIGDSLVNPFFAPGDKHIVIAIPPAMAGDRCTVQAIEGAGSVVKTTTDGAVPDYVLLEDGAAAPAELGGPRRITMAHLLRYYERIDP